MDRPLNHERLDVYRLAVEVARWIASAQFPTHLRALEDQALARFAVDRAQHRRGRVAARASRSESLSGSRSGPVAETCAVLDLVALAGAAEQQAEAPTRRVDAVSIAVTSAGDAKPGQFPGRARKAPHVSRFPRGSRARRGESAASS
jgi:hypothetical protein